jgi:hypothetical protein
MDESKPAINSATQPIRIEGREEKEHDKEFFALQIQFAKKMAEVTSEPFFDVLLKNTNLYRRFGLGKASDPNNPVWKKFISHGEENITDRAYQLYLAEKDNAPKKLEFGCFKYKYVPETKTVFIHFYNKEKTDSPLKDQEKRKQELKTMFEYIKQNHPEAELVRGHSWLYNLEQYRSIFPSEYTQNMQSDEKPSVGLSTWGQFLDRRLKTRPDLVEAFLNKINSAKTKQEILDAFPNKVMLPQTDIENFYKYLNIK